jgi:hypothetical protein
MTMRIIHGSAQNPNGHTLPPLKCTRTQLEAALALYTTLIEAKGDPQADKLLHRLHLFMDTLLRPGDLSGGTIACPTDQVLFILSIRDDDTYSTSSAVSSSSAALQYSFRSILVQTVRHIFDDAETFTWFQPPPGQTDDVQGEQPVDAVELGAEDETDDDEPGLEKNMAEELQEPEEDENLEANLDLIMGKIYTCECFPLGTLTAILKYFDASKRSRYAN